MANRYFMRVNEVPGGDSVRVDRIACHTHPDIGLIVREMPTESPSNDERRITLQCPQCLTNYSGRFGEGPCIMTMYYIRPNIPSGDAGTIFNLHNAGDPRLLQH